VKRPTTEQLDTAIAWLNANNGDHGEAERCTAVARWLEHDEQDRMVRSAARKAGVPVAKVRERLGR
jgi:hypothetical protein